MRNSLRSGVAGQTGATLVEVLTALFLVSVGFALTFEVLRGYLQQHKRTLGQMLTLGELIELRDFFLVHLIEGTKGEGLRPAQGGAFPVGRESGGALVGTTWIGDGGRRLYVLERVSEGTPGSLVYMTSEGTSAQLIVSGLRDERYADIPLVLIGGLPAPEGWKGTPDEPPVTGEPYSNYFHGYIARVVSSRPAQPTDIPDSDPRAEALRESINFELCRWFDVRVEGLPALGLPRPAGELLAATRDGLRTPTRRIRVSPLSGLREVWLTPGGGLATRFNGGGETTLLSDGTLRSETQFRYIGRQLDESVARPLLKDHLGISFSGIYISPESGLPYPIYLPMVMEDWLPAR